MEGEGCFFSSRVIKQGSVLNISSRRTRGWDQIMRRVAKGSKRRTWCSCQECGYPWTHSSDKVVHGQYRTMFLTRESIPKKTKVHIGWMQCLISFVCTWTDVDLRKTSNCQSGLWQKCPMTYQSFLLSPHMQMQYLINSICIIEWENASLFLSYVYEVGSCLFLVDCSWIISWLDWIISNNAAQTKEQAIRQSWEPFVTFMVSSQ